MGSLLLWAALNATTTPHRRLTNRPTRTAPLGPAPKAIVLFTHLRRCGGSFVEDALLKPHAKRLGSKPLLCKEGALARLQRLAHPLRRQFKRQLEEAPLVWRHCPFGAHELLGEERPYVYITMLRKPYSRMASWFAYCDKYSRDKCHTAPYQVHGGSKILNFYQARRRKYDSIEPSKLDAARSAPVINAQTFHPNWLEYALDDNYASSCVEIKILRRVCPESPRRPPRHRRDTCSMAWRCRFLIRSTEPARPRHRREMSTRRTG